jgi:hypothetical protein
MASDKVGGRYFLNDYVVDNQEAIQNGGIPDDALHPDSFNPDHDNRMHEYYANRIKKAFDPNFQTPTERKAAEELIAQHNNTQENTQS